MQEAAQEAAQVRAASRRRGRDGMGEMAQGERQPRGEMRWEVAQRDGAGKVEMAWVRRSRVGDSTGQEVVRDGGCRGG